MDQGTHDRLFFQLRRQVLFENPLVSTHREVAKLMGIQWASYKAVFDRIT